MKKTTVSSNSLGTFLSPEPRTYIHQNGAFNHKGWSSERVPHPSTAAACVSRRTTSFYSGRTLPSKWEDAERWICSPVAAVYSGGVCKNPSVSSQRRRKSKSGPIVAPPPPGLGAVGGCNYYYSPAGMQVVEGNMSGLMMMGSPFSTGVLEADRVYRGCNNGGGGGSGGGHEWSGLVSEVSSSSPSSKEEKADNSKEEEGMASPVVVSRRDMATQMSPEGSPKQSPTERGASSFYPSPPLILSVVESQPETPSNAEVREVKVDKRANMTKRSKRRGGARIIKRGPPEAEDVYKNAAPAASASSWDIIEPTTSISKLQREEAKIAAWENLQKAKAEAAIRKLEVKLEKKKSASMDKILNKLQMAQMKAQEMRSSISSKQQVDQIPNHFKKITSFRRRHTLLSPFTSCFTHRVDCRSAAL